MDRWRRLDLSGEQLRRTVVIGTSCSGKTTFAGRLGASIRAPHVELDAIHWGPRWRAAPLAEFRTGVDRALRGERWVVDGNYSHVQDISWGRATAIVWLNYPFSTVFWRALRRTCRRVFRKEVLFSENRETFRDAFLSRGSILLWVITTHWRRRRRYRELLAGNGFPHLLVVELNRPEEAEEFLMSIPPSGQSS